MSIARKSGLPVKRSRFDVEVDIVIVGAGAAGLASALFARWQGNEIVLLEKADELGGTTRKAAFWYWVPNNRHMQEIGIEDRRDDCIRYMARLSRPEAYDPEHPTFGMSQWEYDSFAAIYDNASIATELLAEKGALEYRHCDFVPDYWAELPEDKAPKGRVLLPKNARESMSDGGEVAIRTMSAKARADGVDIRTGHRVQRTNVDESGAVIGVEADTALGTTVAFKARKAVIFASGGFTHDVDMRKNFLSVPVFGGCAVRTNEGDFVNIGAAAGAQLRNMNYAWMCPIVLEKALNDDPSLIGTFSPSGDSMIYVDRNGRRVTNEKLAYNESAQAFFTWDPTKSEYPNLVLVAIWDARSQQYSASDEYGRFIVPEGRDDGHVIKGDSLAELTSNIRARFNKYANRTGNLTIADDFEEALKSTISRFNKFAREGKDLDFNRGERQVELLFNGPAAESPAAPNPTMYPICDEGPYYAALLAGGSLDTKGGPVTNPNGQVLDHTGRPIRGLYGVGNCVASASARAYWAGGATLGPILAFAYLAASAASGEPRR
ncbi:FAD-dependent oxidoreductase [Sinorhizobium alkalisoli]|uniref:FAD-dependent oxidoreductase n=1 Tax=Sinorhizobium alkalisoli TaxID=1752398 RepID=UPI00124D989F|nr:FAD-dependent oxidoreductase [Sinorhizobium alkalisoli]QFI69505.1 flavoprotein [Sinorhizobium alkalisoli]